MRLGAILYEMLTARPPFSDATADATVLKVQTGDLVNPRVIRRGMSGDLEAICMMCLEKAPERRYKTAQALADDLGRFLEGKPVVAKHARVWRRAWKLSKRHPIATASTIAVGLVAVVAAMLTTAWLEERRSAKGDCGCSCRSVSDRLA